ncbi:MFS multidrug transporter [Pseudohyphozyma bogoriensis]|nr:MFS multidrug transporter [Pseudohyphozyma bogoriensis]
MQSPTSETSTLATSPPASLSDKPSFPPSSDDSNPAPAKFRPTRQFWLVFLSLCAACFLSALDLTAVSTTLPSIAADLNSGDFSWVGSAYALSSTAFVPWFGGFAAIFGRRPTMLAALVFFAIGSAIAGSAHSMNILIVGRTIQGVGGGGILTMAEILTVDLIPLADRGAYVGILGSVWGISSAIGPPIGGAFGGGNGLWRWLFYMNLPIAGIAIILVAIFLDVKVPPTTMSEKLAQMDYVNVIFVAATTSAILGITWAGSTYSWGSSHVLVPLVLGLVGIAVYLFIEKTWVKNPTVPFEILTNRTTMVGYVTNWLHGVTSTAVIFYLPVYFQAAKNASALRSGIDLFSLSFTVVPFGVLTGASVTITGHYMLQNLVGWGLSALGFGLTTLLKVDSPQSAWVGYPVIIGIGIGILFAGTTFPVLAPLRPEQQPHAMAFHAFTRAFGQAVSVAIGATVLDSQLAKTLPKTYLTSLGSSAAAYASVLDIKKLAEPLQQEVKVAFVSSLKTVWQVMIGISCLGLVVALGMKQMQLATTVDENWGLKEEQKTEKEVSAV